MCQSDEALTSPLCDKGVKVKSQLPWRPKDVRDARIIRHPVRRTIGTDMDLAQEGTVYPINSSDGVTSLSGHDCIQSPR